MRTAATSLVMLFGCSSPVLAAPTPIAVADLTKRPLPMAATIDLHGGSLADDTWSDVDAIGLATVIPIAAITLAGARIDITPATPGQMADRDVDKKANAGRFRMAAERITPSGEWARLYQWREGDQCFLTGGSPRAQLRCHSHELKLPCASETLLDICTSITPKGAPIAPRTDLAVTFPVTKEPLARTAMGAVATAIMTDDRATFERYLAPAGVAMMSTGAHPSRRRITPRQIHDTLAHDSVKAFAGVDCHGECRWSDNLGEQPRDIAAMTPDTASFGVIRVLRFARQADKTWKLAAIEDLNLGDDH